MPWNTPIAVVRARLVPERTISPGEMFEDIMDGIISGLIEASRGQERVGETETIQTIWGRLMDDIDNI